MPAVAVKQQSESRSQPNRGGRPRLPAGAAVEKYADAILRSDASVAWIAQEYGVSRMSVYRWLKRAHA